jgi:hypothetical protein
MIFTLNVSCVSIIIVRVICKYHFLKKKKKKLMILDLSLCHLLFPWPEIYVNVTRPFCDCLFPFLFPKCSSTTFPLASDLASPPRQPQ